MGYRKEMEHTNTEILSCQHYLSDGGCDGLTDVSDFKYKHGPEITYIGSKYGKCDYPRVLFTRLNRPWCDYVGWFGTRESIRHFKENHPECTITDIQNKYLKGWCNKGKIYRGIQDAGTVTGHPNRSKKSSVEKRKCPRYGVQVIMKEMITRNVFPKKYDSPLDFCAINNVIKCSGERKYYNPTPNMKKNCRHYENELKILNPQVLIGMGNKAQEIIERRFCVSEKDGIYYLKHHNKSVLYFKVPHPNGRGPYAWKGKGVEQWIRDNPFHEKFTEQNDKRWYKTEIILNYILNLVSQVKQSMC